RIAAARKSVASRGVFARSASAILAEVGGDYESSANHLRALVGGLPARTNPWFEAKVDQMRVLAKLDPQRARTVIDQYRTLYPDLGPEPWRTRIAELDAQVPKSGGSARGATGGSVGEGTSGDASSGATEGGVR
ncbi:MAG: hypothetical protein ACKO3W_04605, partial [bacterium]